MTDDIRREAEKQVRAVAEKNGWTPERIEAEIEKLVAKRQGKASSASSGGRQAPSRGKVSTPPSKPEVTDQAPYRFVRLNEHVVAPPEDTAMLALDEPLKGGFCGHIEIELVAETPLLIGKQEQDGGNADGPLRLGDDGPYAVPGASLRGMLRSQMEALFYARMGPRSVNRHHRYGVRDFKHPLFAEDKDGGSDRNTESSSVLDSDKVHAGWLHRDGERCLWVTPCKDWGQIAVDDLITYHPINNHAKDRQHWLGKSLLKKYEAAGMAQNNNKDKDKDKDKTVRFDSEWCLRPVDRTKGPYKNSSKPYEIDPSGPHSGVLVFSGKAPGQNSRKKFEYVFFNDAQAEPVPLRADVAETFERIHSRPGRNRYEPQGSWKDWQSTLEAGGAVPVFYVGDLADQSPDTFALGLTRLFKVPHRHSVGEVLDRTPAHALNAESPDDLRPDFVENLFGYVYEAADLGLDPQAGGSPQDLAHKGRLAFGFLTCPGAAAAPGMPVETVMMGPRASFAPYYLAGTWKDYSAADTRLAGRKRYPVRFRTDGPREAGTAIEAQLKDQVQPDQSNDIKSRLRFLYPKAGGELRFTGRIRFHNVSAAELGAVLWALTHGGAAGKPFRHQLGRARPFGAGQVRLDRLGLHLRPNDEAARGLIRGAEDRELATDDGRDGYVDPAARQPDLDAPVSLRPFLQAITTFMRRQPGLDRWPRTPEVLELLGTADPALGAAEAQEQHGGPSKLSYMPLQRFAELKDYVALKANLPPGWKPALPRRLLEPRAASGKELTFLAEDRVAEN